MFKILRSVDMVGLKEYQIKWPTWVYMLFVPIGTSHVFIGLGLKLLGLELVDYGLCYSQDLLQPFSRQVAIPPVGKLEA